MNNEAKANWETKGAEKKKNKAGKLAKKKKNEIKNQRYITGEKKTCSCNCEQ